MHSGPQFRSACLPPPRHRRDGRRLRGCIGDGMNKHLNAIRKAGAGSLLLHTKAMNRVRAIAANRTQSSLTGGCLEPRIVRICTEFAAQKASPTGRAQPGRAASASVASRGRRASKAASWRSRGVAHVRAAVRSRSEDERRKTRIHSFETCRPCQCARVESASHIYRFARRGGHATVKEVLKQAIAASNHWRIIRNGAAQHF